MSHTLYLTRNGLLEPLGQSQIFPYLRGLSGQFQIFLLSSEKAEDWTDCPRIEAARADCKKHMISWQPRPFRNSPKLLGPIVSLLGMTWRSLRLVRRNDIRLVHARSYLPAAVAWLVWRLTDIPFIFDMRALWPEEMVTAGRLRRGSIVHSVLLRIERVCLRDAAAVVSLTEAAVEHLREAYPAELAQQRVVVIPTCADLDRFELVGGSGRSTRVHGCIGTVLSGWFRMDWLKAWIDVASERDADAVFEIITRDDPIQVRQALDPSGQLGTRLSIASRLPERMPAAVQGHDLSVMFYAGGEVSELGRSPTRMAEVLGCGRPVVANAGVGDVAKVVSESRVGVLVEGPAPEQIAKAMDELEELMTDPDLASRCRRVAVEHFSLESGVASYRALYREILG